MKKWLVGLMAAGLCAASAWATDYTLISSVGDLSEGDYVIVDGKLDSAMANSVDAQNRISAAAVTISDGVISDPDSSVVWTLTKSGDNWLISSATSAGTVYAAAPTSAGNKSRLLSEPDGNFTLWSIDTSSKSNAWLAAKSLQYPDRYLQRNNAASSAFFACYTGTQNDMRFFQAPSGPVEFSVKLDHAEAFEVVQGKPASITAKVQGAQGDVSYAWSVDGTPIDLIGNVYEIDSSEVGGPYEVTCEATDGTSSDSASVKYTVVEAPVVTGDDYTRISSVDALQDGTLVVLTDPDGTYALSASVEGSVFAVAEVADHIDGNVLTTDDAGIVWKLVADSAGNYSLYNEKAAQYAGHAGGGSSNSGRLQNDPFPNAIAIADAEAGLFSATSIAADSASNYRTLQYNYNNGSPRFAYYKGTQKNLRIYAAETGPATFSLALTASATEVEQGDPLTITATVKNAEGEVAYVWQVGMGVVGEAHVTYYTVDTASMEPGDYQVGCKAQDAVADPITETVTFTVKAPVTKYDVILPVGGNGFITATPEKAAAGADVALTATANSGYKFVGMSVIGVDSGDTIATFTTSTGTFQMPAEDVRVGATFEEVEGVIYTLVASDTDFAPGADYIIVATGNGFTNAMSNVTTNDRILVADVSIADNAVLVESDDIVWTIAAASNNKYTLYNGVTDKYVAAPTNANDNKAFLVGAGTSDEAQWTISVATNSLVTIGSVHEGKSLLRNSTAANAYFANYKSGAKTYLYKKAGASAPYITSTGDTTVTLPDGEFSIQFSLKGYEGEYTWVKDGREGGRIDENTGLYTWKPTEADEYSITVRAVDGETVIASTDVTLVVKEAPKSYTVEVADGIINGTVQISVGGEILSSPATVLQGTTVTLIAEPADRSYKLGSMTVKTDGGDVVALAADNSFPMPPDNVTVYAEFVENVLAPYYFQFEDSELPGNYSGTSAELVNAGTTSGDVPKVAFVLQRACRGNADNDRKVGTAAMRLAPVGGTNAIACNSNKFSEAITAISFQYAIYGSDKVDSFTVSTSEDGENWTPLADLTEQATTALQTYESRVSGNAFFIRFEATSTVKDNNHRLNIDEIQLWTGEPEPSISYDSSLTTVVLPASFSIPFELKDYESGEFSVEWGLVEGGEGAINKDTGVYTWKPTKAGYYPITVEARVDGVLIADEDVTLTVIDMTPPGVITLTCDPVSVTMEEGGSAEVTVTLTGAELSEEYPYIYFVDNPGVYIEESGNSFNLADLNLTAGKHELTIAVGNGVDEPLTTTTLTVTVTSGGGSGGEEDIAEFSVDPKNGTLSFRAPSGDFTVKSTKDLVKGPWDAIQVTVDNGRVIIPMTDGPRFYRIGDPQ